MKFKLRPILSEIKELYQQPISEGRFTDYLNKLQGKNKNDLILPIAGFNPMAKEHVLHKIAELEALQAEELMQQVIKDFNEQDHVGDGEFIVVLNLADDLKGAWTDSYTTDFDSKFKLNAFMKRKFCTPYFWTSEEYSKEKIISRTKEYLFRTKYCLTKPKPKTLEDYFQQELFVAKNCNHCFEPVEESSFIDIALFYSKHKLSEAQDLIFNFFYGDDASEYLQYKQYGIRGKTGYEYAQFLASKTT